jgi:hypothetical protein
MRLTIYRILIFGLLAFGLAGCASMVTDQSGRLAEDLAEILCDEAILELPA